jgi:chemotaxis signal transduction protein
MALADRSNGWLSLQSGDHWLAIAERSVGEVIRQRDLSAAVAVPWAPDWVVGLTSLRGHPLLVVDLARRCGWQRRDSVRSAIIVIQGLAHEGSVRAPLGLWADRVHGLLDPASCRFSRPALFGGTLPAKWVHRVIEPHGRATHQGLDLEWLLPPAELATSVEDKAAEALKLALA